MIIISSGIDSWIFCQDTQETLVCKYASKQHVNTTKELNRKKQLVTEETCCFIFYCIDQLSGYTEGDGPILNTFLVRLCYL